MGIIIIYFNCVVLEMCRVYLCELIGLHMSVCVFYYRWRKSFWLWNEVDGLGHRASGNSSML